MGGKCCTDRKDVQVPAHKEVAHLAGAGRNDRKSAANVYDNKKRAISIGYHSKGDDAEKFDKAYETQDLKAFVSLLSSKQPIEEFEERMHPWAQDPKTVGALAGTQLAILASQASEDNPSLKKHIREAGAIPPLVDFLKSNEQDRIQTAVVALSFLTTECPENVEAVVKAGAMKALLACMDSPVAGMRAAAALTLRNTCMEKEEFRKEFVKLGGIKALVNQLSSAPDPSLKQADVQLEAILNLQDLVEDPNTENVIEEYAKQARDMGAIAKLKKLAEVEDEEVSSAATELIEFLGAPKK